MERNHHNCFCDLIFKTESKLSEHTIKTHANNENNTGENNISASTVEFSNKTDETKVATILGIFPLVVVFFFLPPLFKTTEGVVVGFRNFAWAPN